MDLDAAAELAVTRQPVSKRVAARWNGSSACGCSPYRARRPAQPHARTLLQAEELDAVADSATVATLAALRDHVGAVRFDRTDRTWTPAWARPRWKADDMDLEFSGEIWYWRGPAPFYFVSVPEEESADLHAESSVLSYGWGCIPVRARIGATGWRTALIPKDGRYAVPVKAMVRRAEDLDEGDVVTVRLNPEGPS